MRRVRSCSILSLVPLLALFVAGCASASGGGGGLSDSVLTHEELIESNEDNLYDVLKNHPSLEITRSASGQEVVVLGNRGSGRDFVTGAPEPMLLVLDGVRMEAGIPDVLRDLELDSVEQVKILRPGQAGSRYGTGSQNGVLVVETRH